MSDRQGSWTRRLASFCWLQGSARVSPNGLIPHLCWGGTPRTIPLSPGPPPRPVLLRCALMGLWTITSLSEHQSSVPGPTRPHTFLSSRVYDQGRHAHQSPTSSYGVFSGRRGSRCQSHDHRQSSRPRGPAQARRTAPPPPGGQPHSAPGRSRAQPLPHSHEGSPVPPGPLPCLPLCSSRLPPSSPQGAPPS